MNVPERKETVLQASSKEVTLILSSVITLGPLTLLVTSYQITWAAFIICKEGLTRCYGTPSNDIILGTTPDAIIHGGAGDDYIVGSWSHHESDYIYGDDGNDIMFGGEGNDYLNGGRGNDKYDGGNGDDTLIEYMPINIGASEYILSGDDDMAGGVGDDYLSGGEGRDKLYGGFDDDYIEPSPGDKRDFSPDFIDCGSGTDKIGFRLSDGDIAINCEHIPISDG